MANETQKPDRSGASGLVFVGCLMLGLAAGRILSLLVDGMPHWLLLVYLGLELGFGTLGILLARKTD